MYILYIYFVFTCIYIFCIFIFFKPFYEIFFIRAARLEPTALGGLMAYW